MPTKMTLKFYFTPVQIDNIKVSTDNEKGDEKEKFSVTVDGIANRYSSFGDQCRIVADYNF